MENKQTAIEWLVEKLNQCEPWYSGLNDSTYEHINGLIEQARNMEREQHGETWDAALIQVDKRGGVLIKALVDFDKYWEDDL